MITTTLSRIKEHQPCPKGWRKLLKHLNKTEEDDDVLPFSVIVESNGLDDTLWCWRVEPQYAKEWRLFAVFCARRVQHLMKDKRSLAALDVAERFANGEATENELAAARVAAWDAAAAAARVAAEDTADAAWAAARAAAWAAARDAAWAAGSMWAAADVEREIQKVEFLRVVNQEGDL